MNPDSYVPCRPDEMDDAIATLGEALEQLDDVGKTLRANHVDQWSGDAADAFDDLQSSLVRVVDTMRQATFDATSILAGFTVRATNARETAVTLVHAYDRASEHLLEVQSRNMMPYGPNVPPVNFEGALSSAQADKTQIDRDLDEISREFHSWARAAAADLTPIAGALAVPPAVPVPPTRWTKPPHNFTPDGTVKLFDQRYRALRARIAAAQSRIGATDEDRIVAELLGLGNKPTAEQVRDACARADRDTLELVARLAPGLVGHLDGVPTWMRDVANRGQMWRDLEHVAATDPKRANVLTEILASDYSVLIYDPAGDGKIAVGIGDIDHADYLGVIVPGMTTQLGNFDHNLNEGRDLDAAMEKQGNRSHATIVWLGYNPPDIKVSDVRGITIDGPAVDGARALRSFVHGVALNNPGAEITMIGHSYGSLCAGIAARKSIDVDRVVFIGSPGTGVDHASDLHIRPGGEVFVGVAAGDPVTELAGGGKRAGSNIGQITGAITGGPISGFITGKIGGEIGDKTIDRYHGVDPNSRGYGAQHFDTTGSHGHSEYYEKKSSSLENLARITTGSTPT